MRNSRPLHIDPLLFLRAKWLTVALLLALFLSTSSQGQTPSLPVPSGKMDLGKMAPSIPGQADLSTIPASSKELEAYKGYLKRIKSFKEQYVELGDQLDSLKKSEVRDEIKDSLWTALKDRAKQQAEEQMQLMEEIKKEVPAEFESIQQSATSYREFLEARKDEIGEYTSYEQMEFYLDNAEENLKAFTNEHLSTLGKDQLEAHLHQEAGKVLPKEQLDVYGVGLETLDIDADEVKKQAQNKLTETGKKQISERTGKLGEWKNKLPENAGNLDKIKKEKESLKKKIEDFKLFGENELKGAKFRERWMIGASANSLDAFGEGINGSVFLGYRFTQYLAMTLGPNLKKEWKPMEGLSKEGYGGQAALQYCSVSGWLGQVSLEHNYVDAQYPDLQSDRSFKGYKTYPLVGVGKEVALIKGLKTTFMGLFDPFYQANTRLHSKQFLLRVGVVYYKDQESTL